MNTEIAKVRANAILKPDSITTSTGDFLATHVSMNQLQLVRKFTQDPHSDEKYSEEALYQKIVQNPENKHQLVAVYGQSGTGKSHLIRWFKARFDQDKNDDEVVLFIRRNDNSLKGTIKQLLELPEIKYLKNENTYKMLLNATIVEDEGTLKDRIYHEFIIKIDNDKSDESSEGSLGLTKNKRRQLSAYLSNDDVRNRLCGRNGPIDRIYSKVAANVFADRDTLAEFKPEDLIIDDDSYDQINRTADKKAVKLAKELYADYNTDEFTHIQKYVDYLNQFVNAVIQRCAGIQPGDFAQIFNDIRRELYNQKKTLTLFIEDVTSFSGIDTALLDALLVPNTGEYEGLCRLSSIIGSTSGYLQKNFMDNYRDRISCYIYLPGDTFDETKLEEFVARYVNTMSLDEKVIDEWVKSGALPEDYPVHKLIEGKNWEYIDIGYSKSLCLYPFDRNCIRYMNDHILLNGHRTPREIINDLITPVINEILNAFDDFPSTRFRLVGVNNNLSFAINRQFTDEQIAERIIRFLTIWGNNNPITYEKNNLKYISGIPEIYFDDLKIPKPSFAESKEYVNTKIQISHEQSKQSTNKTQTSNRKKSDADSNFEEIKKILFTWKQEKNYKIDVSTNNRVTRDLKNARDELNKYIEKAIDWQAEGISWETINKEVNKKIKFVELERQLRGQGKALLCLEANNSNIEVILSFVRKHLYGNDNWNYEGADVDVFSVTNWIAQRKNEIIDSVKYNHGKTIRYYHEAALANQFIGKLLHCDVPSNYSEFSYLKEEHILTPINNQENLANHSEAWKKVTGLFDKYNNQRHYQTTITLYYSLIQGTSTPSINIFDSLKLSQDFNRIKKWRLKIPENHIQLDNDKMDVKKFFEDYQDLYSKLERVIQGEKEFAKERMAIINNSFDNPKALLDSDIEKFLNDCIDYYKEIEKSKNITSIRKPEKEIKNSKKRIGQITKTIKRLNDSFDQEDLMNNLLFYSTEPLAQINEFINLLEIVDKNSKQVEQQLINNGAGEYGDYTVSDTNELLELKASLEENDSKLNALRGGNDA